VMRIGSSSTTHNIASASYGKVQSPIPKKLRILKLKVKTILICFLNPKGIIRCEFIPPKHRAKTSGFKFSNVRADPWPDKLISYHDSVIYHKAVQ
jgi:hypothetical protein